MNQSQVPSPKPSPGEVRKLVPGGLFVLLCAATPFWIDSVPWVPTFKVGTPLASTLNHLAFGMILVVVLLALRVLYLNSKDRWRLRGIELWLAYLAFLLAGTAIFWGQLALHSSIG